MGIQKKEHQKKVLDALKDQLQPLSQDEGASLTGGFTSASEESLGDIGANIPCNTNDSNTSCTTNTVAGCGA